jgi:hypothetical protein
MSADPWGVRQTPGSGQGSVSVGDVEDSAIAISMAVVLEC